MNIIQPKTVLIKNFTNIIFNNRLKVFFRKMKLDLEYCFEILKDENPDLRVLGDTQTIMRGYIDENRPNIDFITKNQPIYKPDYFALLIAVSSDFENNSSYNECLLEFKGNDLLRYFDYDDEKTKCAGSREIHCANGFCVWSSITKANLVLGCECIK